MEIKMSIVDEEITNALISKGYTWDEIRIRPYLGYTYIYGVYLDGKLREVYNTTKKAFYD